MFMTRSLSYLGKLHDVGIQRWRGLSLSHSTLTLGAEILREEFVHDKVRLRVQRDAQSLVPCTAEKPMRWRIVLMVSTVAEGKKHAKHLR